MALNLEYLLPEKYRSSEIMVAYITANQSIIETWISSIENLSELANPLTVPIDYIQYLADLMGAVLTSGDDATEAERRAELIQTVDWIKLKGTYGSIEVLGLMLGLQLDVLSMYTTDYATFSLVDWYVALNEGDNPTGLSSLYYNTPHFGVQIRLNVRYPATATWTNPYLWEPSMFNNLNTYVEKTRPINTVPHYYITMEPETGQDGATEMVDGFIYTAIQGGWTVTKRYFDDGWKIDETSPAIYFDESQDAFYNGITKWVLGTGNKGTTPDSSDFTGDIDLPVLNGTVDDIRVYGDRVEWEIVVPAVDQNGISELCLYTPGTPDILRLVSLFPDINIRSITQLRIIVTVRRY